VLALALILVAPVTGPVTRDFDPGRPFEAGRHRGVDFAATPGGTVRAACGGPVAFAGRIGGDGIVTLRCGPWRVTHMPLATITARGRVARDAVIGTVGSSPDHAGLHLGVRRDGTRFGYVDPLRFLARPTHPVPLGRAPRGRRPRVVGPPPRPVPRSRPVRPPPRLVPRSHPVRPPPAASSPLAPWPAWAGLALVLAGAGVSLRVRARVRTRSPARRRGSVAA
jgi:Peptidase family M23